VVIAALASLVAPNVLKHVGEAKNVTVRLASGPYPLSLHPLTPSPLRGEGERADTTFPLSAMRRGGQGVRYAERGSGGEVPGVGARG